ncbi:MAG: biotin transporter BioY [Acidobacteriota bacterium]
MVSPRTLVTYDSTLLDHVSVAAQSPASRMGVRVLSVLFLTALTAAASQISLHVPFTPVPFTLQPVVVLMAGAVLGARLGAASQALFLLLGLAGVHAFAASPILPPGAARLLGPTGGFLLAYPLAAALTGWLAGRGFDRRYVSSVVAMIAGLAVIYAGGVAWLAYLMPPQPGISGPVGFEAAVASGIAPFVAADLAKIGAASLLLPTCWRFVDAGGPPRWGADGSRPKTRKY